MGRHNAREALERINAMTKAPEPRKQGLWQILVDQDA